MRIRQLMGARPKGFAMVLTGAVCWGLSGTVAQHLFQNEGFDPGWMVTVRLILSGSLLLTGTWLWRKDTAIRGIWRDPRDRLRLLLFALVGMLSVQYTYFAAIAAGNAATATLLQYLGPVLITGYWALSERRWPKAKEIVSVLLALTGTFLLVTGGRTDSLSISGAALLWGLGSAAALAFYTLYPSELLRRWGSAAVVGWGMVIGGIGLASVHPPWPSGGVWTPINALFILFVILFGTLLPFFLYLESLRYILPTETGLLASAEPLTATVATVLWLGIPFGVPEWTGALCIIATVVLLSTGDPGKREKTKDPIAEQKKSLQRG
ncbi:MAG: EamA family transporter [Planifilum sp.]|jgi:drug/metabolite transporter (DMT)-like permease